jgi:hypothetical protein
LRLLTAEANPLQIISLFFWKHQIRGGRKTGCSGWPQSTEIGTVPVVDRVAGEGGEAAPVAEQETGEAAPGKAWTLVAEH